MSVMKYTVIIGLCLIIIYEKTNRRSANADTTRLAVGGIQLRNQSGGFTC